MRLPFVQKLKALRKDLNGNAVLLVALGMPTVIGGAGLAVDTAQWYMWKRELQHSVDQAAIGAAWALSSDTMRDNYKKRGKQEFDANQSITKKFATTPQFVLADYAGGDDNSVIVSASATRELPFSSFITGNSVTIRVRAQASYQEGDDYNACLVALADDDNVLDIGGNATVKARCGLAALSCEDDAITIDGSATVITDSIATCGTVDGACQ
jgi:Flp pilus assembly protein TadG